MTGFCFAASQHTRGASCFLAGKVIECGMSEITPSALQEMDAQHYLHPFTNHDDLHAAGTHIIERGDGVFLHDAKGRRLLDGLAGLWCVNVGYNCTENGQNGVG